MSLSIADTVADRRPTRLALPLLAGAGIYVLLLVVGNRLLNDPDTYWQIAVGQWIIDHHAVPTTDVYSWTMHGQPWISTQWLAQVVLAAGFAAFGWAGPVVLAAGCASLAFARLAQFLSRRLPVTPVVVLLAAALALTSDHLLARPHALAMPVMVAWVAGLISAAERRAAPSFWLLPLMTLWANLHGGFILGLALVAPLALEAVWTAQPDARRGLVLRWGMFAVAALAASCVTPYGWDALLASKKILSLGKALSLIGEWRPADFSHPGTLEMTVGLGLLVMLWKGIAMPPVRAILVGGFVLMALQHVRSAEVLGLLAPMVLAAPLAVRLGGAGGDTAVETAPRSRAAIAMLAVLVTGVTLAAVSARRYEPNLHGSPVAAIDKPKTLGVSRVFNDYDFGGYMIARGVAPFIDGRTELYGERFMVMHDSASGLKDPNDLFRLLAKYKPDATLMRTQSAATKLLDHMDGWEKVYADDLAVIHLRKPGARHTAEPVINPAAVATTPSK